MATSVARVGGAIAVAPWPERLGIGVAVYVVRLDSRVSADTEVETWSNTFTDFTFQHRFTTFESDRVALSGVVKPARPVTLSVRWRRDPVFSTVRELTARQVLVTGQPGPAQPGVEHEVHFRLPVVYAFGATVAVARTLLVTELARADYGAVFETASEAGAPQGCETLTTIFCPGWAFGNHRTSSATTWRAGIEQSLPIRAGTLRLRGGVALEQGYTLARAAEPPRVDHTWWSVGAAYAWGRFEIGAGFGHTEHQSFLLTDFRVRIE